MEHLSYTVRAFCKAIGVGRTTAYKMAKNHEIEVIRVGGRTLVTARSAHALIERAAEAARKHEGQR